MPRVLEPQEYITDHGYEPDEVEGICVHVVGQDHIHGEVFYCEKPVANHAYKTVADWQAVAGVVVEQGVRANPNVPASEAAIAFTAHAEAVLALVRKKDVAYGGAWQAQGYMGNLARIMSKTARLENILWKDVLSDGTEISVGDETITDTLHDLMALCAFMASNLEEGNRWGQ